MAMFTLHRNFILRTNKGHSIRFVKGVATWVPPLCTEDVIAIGAVPQEDGVDVVPPDAAPEVELTAEQREAKLFDAFGIMLARNEREDFTAANQPHCKKLYPIVGFEVPTGERDEAWKKYRLKQGLVDE
jgi:hypothetical protein